MQLREIVPGRPVHLDAEGFLADRAEWSPELASALARESGIALTPVHWKVIEASRADAARSNGLSPGLRRLSQLSGVTLKELYALFPKGPGKLAARIAGLPKPKSCL